MDDIYQQNILEHYKHPHNKTVPEHFDVKQEGSNPSCGDELTLYLSFDDGKVSSVGFLGDGCAVSQSATSMLTDRVKGMTKEEIAKLSPEDVYDLLGIVVGPAREKCALLSLNTLHRAVKEDKVDAQ